MTTKGRTIITNFLNFMSELTQTGMIVVIVVALTEAVKRAGLSARYAPLLAVLLGLGASMYFDGANFLAAASGVVIGLATTGGYHLVKRTLDM